MRIKEQTYERFAVEIPGAFRRICTVTIVMGSVVTIAVIFSGEGLVNGILGYLCLIAGILGLIYGGKPDSFVVDRRSDQLTVTAYSGPFSKPETRSFPLNQVESVDLDESFIKATRVWAIRFTLGSGDQIIATPYSNQRRRCQRILTALRAHLHFA